MIGVPVVPSINSDYLIFATRPTDSLKFLENFLLENCIIGAAHAHVTRTEWIPDKKVSFQLMDTGLLDNQSWLRMKLTPVQWGRHRSGSYPMS